MGDRMTLTELSEVSGCPARTIRFYIAQGVLDGRRYRVERNGWRDDILEQWRRGD